MSTYWDIERMPTYWDIVKGVAEAIEAERDALRARLAALENETPYECVHGHAWRTADMPTRCPMCNTSTFSALSPDRTLNEPGTYDADRTIRSGPLPVEKRSPGSLSVSPDRTTEETGG